MRRAAKVDQNQAEIVAAFRKLGCAVFPTHQIGQGFPDIFVRTPGPQPRAYVVEIKDGSKPPSARKLTPAEKLFHDMFSGVVEVVTSVEDVQALVSKWRAGL